MIYKLFHLVCCKRFLKRQNKIKTKTNGLMIIKRTFLNYSIVQIRLIQRIAISAYLLTE